MNKRARRTAGPAKAGLAVALLTALACGAALGVDLMYGVVVWFALTPVFLGGERRSRRESFLVGVAAGTGFHAAAIYWLNPAFVTAGQGWLYSAAIWLAAAVFGGLHWGLLWLAAERPISRLPALARPWAWAALWTAAAAACERWAPWPCVFLGYTQMRHLRMLQISAALGPHALGFLIVAVNAALAQAWESRLRATTSRANLAALAAALALTWLYGARVLAARRPAQSAVSIEILHPGIDARRRWDQAFVASVEDGYQELLSRPRARNPAMIFWHEGSIPRWFEDGAPIPEAAPWSRRLGAYQLVGSYATSAKDKTVFNAIYAVGPDGAVVGSYRQRVLIPLLEAVPESPLIRRLLGLERSPLAVPIAAADGVQPLFATPLGLFGASLCFESLFPKLTRADAARGARAVFEASNDSWFAGTVEPEQHLMINVMRAVEGRVSVVRASNEGVSAVIDPWGVVTARMEPSQRGRLDAALDADDPFPGRSYYVRHGDLLGTACMIAAAALILLA